MKLRFRLDPWLGDPYYEPSGVLVALLNREEGGRLSFYADHRSCMFHLESLTVDTAFRGKGIGIALHKKFRALVQRRWSQFQYATGEVTSAGALRLLVRVYGEPLSVADDVKRYTFAEALQRLPCLGRTDEAGYIDCSGGHLNVNVWIGRGPLPKDHPWEQW